MSTWKLITLYKSSRTHGLKYHHLRAERFDILINSCHFADTRILNIESNYRRCACVHRRKPNAPTVIIRIPPVGLRNNAWPGSVRSMRTAAVLFWKIIRTAIVKRNSLGKGGRADHATWMEIIKLSNETYARQKIRWHEHVTICHSIMPANSCQPIRPLPIVQLRSTRATTIGCKNIVCALKLWSIDPPRREFSRVRPTRTLKLSMNASLSNHFPWISGILSRIDSSLSGSQ